LRTAVIRNWMILANCSYSELNTFVHYTWPAKVIWFQRTEEGNAPTFYHALGRTEVTHETNVREFHFGVITCQPSGTRIRKNNCTTHNNVSVWQRVMKPATRNTRFHVKRIPRSAHTVYLCVLCGSENKQRLFHCTALTDWFL
jgi:hypothetical protein